MREKTQAAWAKLNLHMKIMLGVFCALFVLLGSYLFYSTVTYGEEWFASSFNPRISASRNIANAGAIYDRTGLPLAWSTGSTRHYAEDEETRRAVCHVVGDVYGKSMGAETFFAKYLYGREMGVVDRLTTAVSGDDKGGDVYLTIDADLCTYAYERMEFNGAIVVMNYRTGEILAEVSNPTFDPEQLKDAQAAAEQEEENGSQYLNRVTQGRYPPGSTMKIVTSAAAILAGDTGLEVNCTTDGIIIDGQRVTCHEHGEQNFTEAFENSCNIYFAELADDLGSQRMQTAADDALFNYAWHLPDFSMLESNFQTGSNKGDLAWAGIGQYRDLITPMHNMLISAAVGNGGTMMQPNTLLDVRYGNRSAYTYRASALRTVFDPNVNATLTSLMRDTVEHGTATNADIAEGVVCGKTGTAEYTENGEIRNHSWFVGFVQDEDHPLAIAVILEGAGFGSRYATPLAGSVLTHAIDLGY